MSLKLKVFALSIKLAIIIGAQTLSMFYCSLLFKSFYFFFSVAISPYPFILVERALAIKKRILENNNKYFFSTIWEKQ